MPAKVDVELCTGCHSCAEACPNESIEVIDEHAVVKEDECIECAACVEACSTHAVTMGD